MKNEDTRVQFTKKVLKDALLRILQSKPIAKVSIKELCEEAGLNRGTFYLHYTEPMDVLHELENRLVDKIMGDYFGGEDTLTDRLRLMQTERKAYAAILGRHGDPLFPTRACRLADQILEHGSPATIRSRPLPLMLPPRLLPPRAWRSSVTTAAQP